MSGLPPSIEALTRFEQFICWSLIKKEGQPKPAKVPTDPATGRAIDPHDPANWMNADQAFAAAERSGQSVGFVLTADDPFWFLDIDNCAVDGGWSETATALCNSFPGAAVEISQSGRGLHIFGCGAAPAGFKSRNQQKGIEFYTNKRFVALGLNGSSGDIWTDWTARLGEVIPQWFATNEAVAGALVEANGPRPDWSGPADDDELLAKMLANKSAGATFGSKASFKQLWEADPALGDFYPDPEQDRPFDASSADAALLSHLAFWTGCDMERMDRLFRRSGLMRTKWDQRGDYRIRSIKGAAGHCQNVYGGGKGTKRAEAFIPATGGVPTGMSELLTAEEQVKYFENCVYILTMHRVLTPNGLFLKPEQFRACYGGKEFIISMEGKTTKNAFEAFTENRLIGFPQVDAPCFRPELGQGVIIQEEGYTMVNTYIPPNVEMREGDVGPFMRHMQKLIPDERDREILLCYMAACVQYPGKKFQWCPVIQGVEGNGKTLALSAVSYAVGERYSHFPNAKELGGNGGKFNAWIANKLFIGIEEIHTRDRADVVDTLKPMITNVRIESQGKGADQIMIDNRANFIMCSNHRDAVQKTERDRRYAVFYTAQQESSHFARDAMDGDYFPKLYDWLRAGGYAAVAWYLKHFEICDEFNPATVCQRAPRTSSTTEAINESRGSIEQEILEAIATGDPGFRNGWVSSIALDKMLQEHGMARRVPRNKRKDMLASIGYVPHPALPGGRCPTPLFQEQGCPILYVKGGSLAATLVVRAEVEATYLISQGYADSTDANGGDNG